MLDTILGWVVVLVPSAFGVVCAIQALRPPKVEHHKRWLVIFIAAGVLGSAAVLWQQVRTANQSEVQRNELQNQINDQVNRVLFQIENVYVSFRIKIPLEHPAVSGYRQRLEICAQRIVDTLTYKCGATARTLDPENKRIRDFYINPSTELYPVLSTELIAYTLLNHVLLDIGLFKDGKPDGQLPRLENADLRFRIAKTLDNAENSNPSRNSAYVALYYDIDRRSLFVQGRGVPVDEEKWKSTGKIASVSDLQTGLMRVEPAISLVIITSDSQGFQFTEEFRTAAGISKSLSLEHLGLHMSNGYEIQFSEEQLGKAIRDDLGYPVYLTKFAEPSGIREADSKQR